MAATQHMTEPGSMEPTDDGWYEPACTCGAEFGPVPDVEIATDVMMDHAYESAKADARAEKV